MSSEIQDHWHFLIYKPWGMLSQFLSRSKDQRKKRFLGELYNFPEGTMSVGRLDEKSEGLLLLTTQGKMSFFVNSKKVEKEYWAMVDGEITQEAVTKLGEGVDIGINGKTYRTKACEARLLEENPPVPEPEQKIRDDRHGPTSWVSITLKEGKFRQVRKMTAAVGFPTLRLVRVRIGNYKLETMSIGEVIPLENLIF